MGHFWTGSERKKSRAPHVRKNGDSQERVNTRRGGSNSEKSIKILVNIYFYLHIDSGHNSGTLRQKPRTLVAQEWPSAVRYSVDRPGRTFGALEHWRSVLPRSRGSPELRSTGANSKGFRITDFLNPSLIKKRLFEIPKNFPCTKTGLSEKTSATPLRNYRSHGAGAPCRRGFH